MNETTEYGAYGICIAVVEAELGLVVVARADTRTGADWYLASEAEGDMDDLEAAYRLEVSGVDRGDFAYLTNRLSQKVEQTRRGISSLPAITSVVGFLIKLVDIEIVDEDQAW